MAENTRLAIEVPENEKPRIGEILSLIDFNNKEQIALLLFPQLKKGEISMEDVEDLSGMRQAEQVDFYEKHNLKFRTVSEKALERQRMVHARLFGNL